LVRKYLMDEIDDPRLAAYFVWGPMLGHETRPDAVAATAFLTDPRALHFWTGEDRIAERFREVAGLAAGELAWDTFLLYPAGTVWEDDDPPQPAAVWHVGKPLPDEQRLNGEQLRARARELLLSSAAGRAPPE
jgi:hypothetical protein